MKISVQNPRKVGRQYFTSLERNTQASEKSISTPIEVFEYEVFALICCTVSSEPSIFQATFDKRGGGFSGFLGGYESKWIDFYPVDLIVAGSADSLLVPLHEGISKYVFLLKANTEVTGWRIFEVDSKSMSGAIENGLIIPDLTKLPKADSHVLQSALTPIIKEADDYLRKNFAGNLKVP
ncbi:MAG: hypothetical protein JNK76_03235 [Planctomycetales bacterium]|nr:hypothetical protein [Planctomycetales bacterium]MBN8627279.1 hypothetical protein [Planctomycetota bacterium]